MKTNMPYQPPFQVGAADPKTAIPHFAFPFQIGPNGHALQLEQDTDEEIVNCVELIASVVKGSLIDQPDFGVTDPTFTLNPLTGLIAAEIEEWEPRARIRSIEAPNDDDLTLLNMIINVDTGKP